MNVFGWLIDFLVRESTIDIVNKAGDIIKKNAWVTFDSHSLQRAFSSLSSLSSSFSPFSTCCSGERERYMHLCVCVCGTRILEMSIYLCGPYICVCTRGVDTSSEKWSIDVLLTTVGVLFTSVIIVSVRNGFSRLCVCSFSLSLSLNLKRLTNMCVRRKKEQKKKKKKVKQSAIVILHYGHKSLLLLMIDAREEKNWPFCRQDMKIKVKQKRRSQNDLTDVGICFLLRFIGSKKDSSSRREWSLSISHSIPWRVRVGMHVNAYLKYSQYWVGFFFWFLFEKRYLSC